MINRVYAYWDSTSFGQMSHIGIVPRGGSLSVIGIPNRVDVAYMVSRPGFMPFQTTNLLGLELCPIIRENIKDVNVGTVG